MQDKEKRERPLKRKESMDSLIFTKVIPLKVESETNKREHWAKSNNRHKRQKDIVKFNLKGLSLHLFQETELKIKLTRISPRKLDAKDNLPTGFKWIADAIADLIFPGKAAGRADDAANLEWDYDQEKGPPKFNGFRIEIFSKY